MAKAKEATESPKTQTTQAPPQPKKKRSIKRKEQVMRHTEYEIPSRAGVVYMLPQKGVTIYDEAKDTVREIRYCPNEPSIYSDEQSDKALRQSVAFRDGRLFVPKDKPNLKAFLDIHPMNIANGGNVFKKVDKKSEAEAELKREFILSEAVAIVRDKDINDLLPIGLYFGVDINRPVSEIRFNLLNIAKRKTKEFLEAFDSPQVQVRSTVQQAADYQIINIKADGCYWFDANTLIVANPAGQKTIDTMVRFCLTEKGASVLASLEERLDKLA
jgi:hypothetical protein